MTGVMPENRPGDRTVEEAVLAELRAAPEGLTTTMVAAAVGLPAEDVRAALVALRDRGLVEGRRPADRRYRHPPYRWRSVEPRA